VDRFDRIYELDKLLRTARRGLTGAALRERLECSRATLGRVVEDMRTFLDAPIVYDRTANVYHYAGSETHTYELPGLWFNPSELYALLAAQRLLESVQPGLLGPVIAPLCRRIERILQAERLSSGEVARRVRILSIGTRPRAGEHFQTVAGALMGRRRLRIRYHGRARDETSDRSVSPQRLVHYRDNWYLDAWCHRVRGLRTFALDRILAARPLTTPASDIPDPDLDAHFATAYGIFAGEPSATAVLRFGPERARWVAEERWHPDQQGRALEGGGYELCLPYGDPRELVMDILKYGPDVEVLAPEALRAAVAERLEEAARQYREAGARPEPQMPSPAGVRPSPAKIKKSAAAPNRPQSPQ
jgi:proteasome accessory factor C